MKKAMELPNQIEQFYKNAENDIEVNPKCCMFPYIDSEYFKNSNDLKIMQIALNAYIEKEQFRHEGVSSWWSGWAKENKYRLDHSMKKVKDVFQSYSPAEYRTNLIKAYLSKEDGLRSSDVSQELKNQARLIQAQEFDLLLKLGHMPDLIICHGNDSWDGVWPWFQKRNPTLYEEIQKHRCFRFTDKSFSLICIKITHHSARKNEKNFYAEDALRLFQSLQNKQLSPTR